MHKLAAICALKKIQLVHILHIAKTLKIDTSAVQKSKCAYVLM